MRPALWTGMFPQLSVEESAGELATIGFRAGELCGPCLNSLAVDPKSEARVVLLAGLCGRRGIEFTQAHGPNLKYGDSDPRLREAACQRAEGMYPILVALGIKTMVVHAGVEDDVRVEPTDTSASWSRRRQLCLENNIESFSRLVESARCFGIRIAVENVIDGKCKGRRTFGAHPSDLEALFQQVPELGLNLDTAHANSQDLSVEGLIRQFSERLFGLHVSDNRGEPYDYHLTPGKGNINWASVIQALNDVSYEGDLHLEIFHERSQSLQDARRAAEKVRSR